MSKRLFAILVGILLVGVLSGTAMAGQGGFILDAYTYTYKGSLHR